MKVTDHTGREFPSQLAMCEYWGVKPGTYFIRKQRGHDVKSSLTGEGLHYNHVFKKGKDGLYHDHHGKGFETINEMCKHWKIQPYTFMGRFRNGHSLKDSLTGKDIRKLDPFPRIDGYYYDHLGKKYKTITEMCKKYNIRPDLFKHRIRRGFTLKEALTFKRYDQRKTVTDHEGTVYTSLEKMCSHYGITTATYKGRIKHKWPLELALTAKNHEISHGGNHCVDHLGQMYLSEVAMCKHWGVNRSTFKQRMKNNYSLKDALTKAPEKGPPRKTE